MVHGEGKRWISTIITATANFCTIYNYQTISAALLIMSTSQCTSNDDECRKGEQAAWVTGCSEAGIFLGCIVGQLLMGYLGDYFTRSTALSWTMVVGGTGAILSATASMGSPESVYAVIIVFRIILGIGVGGVFPLSAAKASEDTSHTHGKVNSTAAAWAHLWQGPGYFVPWLITYILTYTSVHTDFKWRFLLGFGAVPAVITIILLELEANYFDDSSSHFIPTQSVKIRHDNTIRMHEMLVKDLQSNTDTQQKILIIGTMYFIMNTIIYGISLLSFKIIAEIAFDDDDNITSNGHIRTVAKYQMIGTTLIMFFNSVSTLLVPILGLRRVQLLGFMTLSFFAFLNACFFEYLNNFSPQAMYGLYVLLLGLILFGASTSLYALPAAMFRKEIRATVSGICMALGKVGAIFGSFTFAYLGPDVKGGYTIVLAICTIFAGFGAYLTFYYIHAIQLMNDDHDLEVKVNKQLNIQTQNPKEPKDTYHHSGGKSEDGESSRRESTASAQGKVNDLGLNPLHNKKTGEKNELKQSLLPGHILDNAESGGAKQ